jgi:hypothetical protein
MERITESRARGDGLTQQRYTFSHERKKTKKKKKTIEKPSITPKEPSYHSADDKEHTDTISDSSSYERPSFIPPPTQFELRKEELEKLPYLDG